MTHCAVLIAESVQIDGRLLALFLAIFLILILVALTVAVGGCIAAFRGGRGSTTARDTFLAIAAVELAVAFFCAIGRGPLRLTAGLVAVVAVQAVFYGVGRQPPP